MKLSLSFDKMAAILFFCVGILAIAGSGDLADSSYGSNVGPNIFPFVLGVVLVLLSLRLFYEAFKTVQKERESEHLDWGRFGVIFIAALLYVLLLETIGYIITTFLFLFISFQAMERKRWIVSLVIAGVFSAAVYYIYVEVLAGTLPGWPVWLT